MKNRAGFIPQKYDLEPDYYRCISGCWSAVYKAANGVEYMIKLDAYGFNKQEARTCHVLRQDEDRRRCMFPPFKTLKQAVDAMRILLDSVEPT